MFYRITCIIVHRISWGNVRSDQSGLIPIRYQIHTLLLILHSYVSIHCKAILNNFSSFISPLFVFHTCRNPRDLCVYQRQQGLAVSLPICAALQGVPRLLPEETWMPREKLAQGGCWYPVLRARRWPTRWRNCPCSPARTYHLLTSARTVSPLRTRAAENVHIRSNHWGTNIDAHVHFISPD